MENVQSSALLDSVKALFNLLDKAWDKLESIELENKKQREDGALMTDIKYKTEDGEEHLAKFKAVPVDPDSEKFYNVYMISETGEKFKKENVEDGEFRTIIDDNLLKWFGKPYNKSKQTTKSTSDNDRVVKSIDEEFSEATAASSKLQIGLKKITSSSEIKLTKINATYGIDEAVQDVQAILDDSSFIEALPSNTEVFYEITPVEDELDIQECEDFNVCYGKQLSSIRNIIFALIADIEYAEVSKKTDCFNCCCDSYMLRDMYNDLSRLEMELTGNLTYPCLNDGPADSTVFDSNYWRCAYELAISTLETMRCNYAEDIQNMFNNYIRRMKSFIYYQLEDKCDSNDVLIGEVKSI